MILKGNADTNLCDEDGLSLLHWAADRGRREACEILLQGGANSQLKDEDGQTPLDYAITCEHDDIIKLLEKAEVKDTSWKQRELNYIFKSTTANSNEFNLYECFKICRDRILVAMLLYAKEGKRL